MTVAQVAIPAGLSVQMWQLKELTDKHLFDYFELYQNYVVFYFRELAPLQEVSIALDLRAEIQGTYEAAASAAYLYYTQELKDWAKGESIVIE